MNQSGLVPQLKGCEGETTVASMKLPEVPNPESWSKRSRGPEVIALDELGITC